MKRSEINRLKRQNKWRQGRDEAHCDICVSISSYEYAAGFGTRTQKVCLAMKINTGGIKRCDLFEYDKGAEKRQHEETT